VCAHFVHGLLVRHARVVVVCAHVYALEEPQSDAIAVGAQQWVFLPRRSGLDVGLAMVVTHGASVAKGAVQEAPGPGWAASTAHHEHQPHV
jgi:hypothetical protein